MSKTADSCFRFNDPSLKLMNKLERLSTEIGPAAFDSTFGFQFIGGLIKV